MLMVVAGVLEASSVADVVEGKFEVVTSVIVVPVVTSIVVVANTVDDVSNNIEVSGEFDVVANWLIVVGMELAASVFRLFVIVVAEMVVVIGIV